VRIRFKILLACLALTSITVALGLFALQGQRELGSLATKIYDDAVMSISFVRSAETKFVDLRGQLALAAQKRAALEDAANARAVVLADAAARSASTVPVEESERRTLIDTARGGKKVSSDAARPGEASDRQAMLATARGQGAAVAGRETTPAAPAISQTAIDKSVASIVEDLDVAIERAMSEDGRKAAKAMRTAIGGISSGWKTATAAKQIADVSAAFDQLVEQFAADGLEFRTNAEELVSRGVHGTLMAIGLSVAIGLLITLLLSFTIVPAIRLAARLAEDIASGRLDNVIVVPRRPGRSETAALLAALSRMQVAIRENIDRSDEIRAEQVAAEQGQAQARKVEMRKFADDFEGAVGGIINAVSSASAELEGSAGTLTATAKRSLHLTTIVAAASEEASANVESVASAAEEMTSSINEIGRQVQESARIAGEAVGQARETNELVSELSKAATRIGDVVELINTIAGQTNLLALNATIEAARAGEAGRGFAVVASEVKALAGQTAKATGEISQQITGIQAAMQGSVAAIQQISRTIEQISDISSNIAAAVEEQGAATQEISRSVQQAAHGTTAVSSNITDVQHGADEAGTASSQVLSAAQSLSSESNRLKLEVGKFLNSVRAA
jgi:methyl-accepting chemotaxis protein